LLSSQADGRLLALRENSVHANDVIETGLQRAGIQSGELEIAHSIAAVGCSQQRKERLILIEAEFDRCKTPNRWARN
jgi:hypothetical protein